MVNKQPLRIYPENVHQPWPLALKCHVLRGERDDCEAKFWDRRRLQLRSDGSNWTDPHDTRCRRQIAAPPYELWLCAFSTIPGMWDIGVTHTWGDGMLYDTVREPISALFARRAPRRRP